MRRNRIIAAAVIIGCAVLAGVRGGSIPYLMFYSALIIPLLSLIYVFVVYWKFCIYQKIDSKVLIKEEKVPYLFKLSNEDLITYTKIRVNFMKDYSTVEAMDQSTDYCLLPQDEIHRETMLCCHYKGEYHVGIDYVTVTDYLNLFHFTYACDSKISVQVLPRVVHLNQLIIAPSSEDMKRLEFQVRSKAEIPDIEVRKYQRMDPPGMIHWKATARYGELMTRKYTNEPKTELVILLDLRHLKKDEENRIIIEDKLIEALLAIADYFVRNHMPVSVLMESGTIQRVKVYSKEEFQQLYAICSHLRFTSKCGNEELLSYSLKQGEYRQYCMLLTGQWNDDSSRMAYQYCSMGHELCIIGVGDFKDYETVKKLDSGIHFYSIGIAQEVRDVLEMEAV